MKDTSAACRTNHTQAAAKLHLVYSVLGSSEQQVQLTAQRTHASKVLTIGTWVKGRLLLFELGSCSDALLDRIQHWGGFCISRLKENCTPTIVAVPKGCGTPLRGQTLRAVLLALRRDILDVAVEVRDQKRK